MKPLDQGLVAIIPSIADMAIARDQGWYRIPVSSMEKPFKKHGLPRWIAFYQPKVFGDEAFAVNYYAHIKKITEVSRFDLFPNEVDHESCQKRYYKLELSSLEKLISPIPSQQLRRITFIRTTWEKLLNAKEINDLWDKSTAVRTIAPDNFP